MRRSREGAWIEIAVPPPVNVIADSRSREGAWIEIGKQSDVKQFLVVAPARERGLKSPRVR